MIRSQWSLSNHVIAADLKLGQPIDIGVFLPSQLHIMCFIYIKYTHIFFINYSQFSLQNHKEYN